MSLRSPRASGKAGPAAPGGAGGAKPPPQPGGNGQPHPPRPAPLAVVPANVPAEVKALRQWVVWRYVLDDGEWDKPPFNARTGLPASSTNPHTWSTWDEAWAAYERGGWDGVGVTTCAERRKEGDDSPRLVVLDYDGCRDPETGEVAEWALKLIDELPTYHEASPSGKGMRGLAFGRLPPAGRKRGPFECYEWGRYVTVTGRRDETRPRDVAHCQEAIEAVHRGVFGEVPPDEPDAAAEEGPERGGNGFEDAELVRLARADRRRGPAFAKLHDEGDWDDYPSRSEGMLALINHLVYYAGDPPSLAQVDRIVRQSALCYDKWTGRADYRRRTFARALRGRTAYYRPEGDGEPHLTGDGEPHLTDNGNAARLARWHGQDLRHCHPWKKWLVWDGLRWRLDDAGEAQARAKRVSAELFAWTLAELAKAARLPEPGRKARVSYLHGVQRWALKSEAAKLVNAMLDLVRSEPGIPVLHGDLDRDVWALNCPNGTVDLHTGELRPHRREDLLTKLCPVAYRADARCPAWEATLLRIFGGDPELVGYLQRLFGYCLTGDTREQLLPVFWGGGSNGKSLLIDTALWLLGPDYAGPAPEDLLMAQRQEPHPTGQADLFGRRLVAAVESREGGRLNEALVKKLTGGDRLKARRMREDFWEFDPTHKLILATNHRPEVRGRDHAIWRRLRLVPFAVRFWDPDKKEAGPPELRADKGLKDRLRAEAGGILAWCVRGCLDWQRGGMREPETVRLATTEYRCQQDLVASFVAERCATGPGREARASALYAAFKAWHEAAGEGKAMSQRRFGDSLGEMGYRKRQSNGTVYEGIAVRPPGESAAEEDVHEVPE